MYSDKIKEYLNLHKVEIVENLKELIKIPSVRGEAEEGAPFGKECARALEYTRKLYNENGFETELCKNYGYLLSYYGKGERSLGIFAHSDVVDPGKNWLLAEPFEAAEKDGIIIGRGAIDNKAGVIISLYCAKILKELGIPFKSRLVMFTGSNEESGMADIKGYLNDNTVPDFSVVPDAGFPLYRGNKGCIRFSCKKVLKNVIINAGNGSSVIGDATVELPYSEKTFSEILKSSGEKISALKEGDKIIIKALGIPKHSATPEGGLSALAVISDILKNIKTPEFDADIFNEFYKMSNFYYGEYFKIEHENSDFGKLTCVLTKVETDESGNALASFNIRYGTGISDNDILLKIEKKLKEEGFEMGEVTYRSIPHALSEDNQYVQKVMKVYKNFTGNSDTSRINAGGTYRQYIKNAVETGPTLKWYNGSMEKGHGGAHESDEYISIEGLLKAIEFTALLLLECDKEDIK